MPSLLYCVLARGSTVLARYADCAGNFSEVTDVVLARVDPAENQKMSYRSGDHMYHYLGEPGGIVFLCIADADFDRATCFEFLNACKSAFERQYGPISAANSRARSAIPFAMNTEFSVVMAAEMKRANQGKLKGPDSSTAGGGDVEGDGEPLLDRAGEEGEENPDKIERLKEEVRQVKDIMVANIDSIVERGERMELLVERTEALSSDSLTFKRNARVVRRRMWWQNTKTKLALGAVAVVVLYGIVSAACGGPLWPKCV